MKMKKFISLFIALMLLLIMAAPALAAQGTNSTSGTITIANAAEGHTYTIYQILQLESYNTEANAYAYKATEAWEDFIKSDAIKDVYLSTDDEGYVTWVKGADAAAFAKLAQAYAKEHAIGNQGSEKAVKAESSDTITVKFEKLNLGYYLVDSTLGTLCSLDTTDPDVTIQEKNGTPTNKKTVKEDSTDNFRATNDADIGQVVEFQSTITAQAGAENYVFHDTMSAGLTYKEVTGITLNGTAVDTKYYTVKTSDLTDKCTFEVSFTQDFCDTLKTNDKIVISYTATVNENAVIGLNGNPNESRLSYGDSSNTSSNTTPPSKTITYVWDMDVLKYANGDESKVLKDAQFVLLNNNKTMVATVVNGKLTGWVNVPTADEDGTITLPDNTTLTTDENGKIEIDGLDSDTYYLREIKAPNGYNKLANDVEVKITGATKKENTEDLVYTTVIAKVNNQSGAELPSTGGIGTTIFYVVGGAMVLVAVVLLVTRKKMSVNKD